MNRKRTWIILISVAVLILTVPWFFTQSSSRSILGFPTWAFYSISCTLGYALLLILLIGVGWKEMEK